MQAPMYSKLGVKKKKKKKKGVSNAEDISDHIICDFIFKYAITVKVKSRSPPPTRAFLFVFQKGDVLKRSWVSMPVGDTSLNQRHACRSQLGIDIGHMIQEMSLKVVPESIGRKSYEFGPSQS